jgi:hypothetical protein
VFLYFNPNRPANATIIYYQICNSHFRETTPGKWQLDEKYSYFRPGALIAGLSRIRKEKAPPSGENLGRFEKFLYINWLHKQFSRSECGINLDCLEMWKKR